MSGFTRHRRSGKVIATFSGFEADLLRSLASQLVELLRNEAAVPSEHSDPLEAMLSFEGPTTEPDDPVLARLFPTAYPDNAEAAAEFRRFTEGALRDGKAAGAAAMIDALEEAGLPPELGEDKVVIDIELDEGAAQVWLKTFTDLRLALATRLEVEENDEEFWAALPDDDPRSQAHDIYEWIGALQETLVDALR
ncbi:MAG TPA: DUF2017 domain-containing protein [Nocardioides sp.]|nr:DUF2017 domain-containing protein [Nocardioides sp.]